MCAEFSVSSHSRFEVRRWWCGCSTRALILCSTAAIWPSKLPHVKIRGRPRTPCDAILDQPFRLRHAVNTDAHALTDPTRRNLRTSSETDVCVCLFVYIYTHTYVHMYIYIQRDTHTHVDVYLYMYVCRYAQAMQAPRLL